MNRPFSHTEKDRPIVAGIATGLYPVIAYYSHNYTLVNSWEQLLFFCVVFLVLPCSIALILYTILKQPNLVKWRKPILVLLSLFLFFLFIEISHYAELKKKLALLTFVICIPLAYLLKNYLSKILMLQYFIALVGLFSLVPTLVENWSISSEWKVQPDAIGETVFTTHPNVYFIQPDGYPNFSELKRGHYKQEDASFEDFLLKNGFKNYENFRSNYTSTLASNAAIFNMKHHYYNGGINPHQSLEARKSIISENPILSIFKRNGYATHLIIETPYLLLNHPKLGFDTSNFSTSEVPFIGNGFRRRKDVEVGLKGCLEEMKDVPSFFFIEFISPGHIQSGTSIQSEKEAWLLRLDQTNKKLRSLVVTIKEKDPESLIIILSDHGGYVGFKDAKDIYKTTNERDDVYSIFSSQLSIHWPKNGLAHFDSKLHSSVNTFRTVFAYLAQDEKIVDTLQENASFVILNDVQNKGVFQYLDERGKVIIKQNDGI